jgi:hypothetical protein
MGFGIWFSERVVCLTSALNKNEINNKVKKNGRTKIVGLLLSFTVENNTYFLNKLPSA